MPGVLIKNMPPTLHQRIKQDAVLHHRSMTKHIIALLEEYVDEEVGFAFPKPIRTRFRSTARFINEAKRQGRE